MITNQAEKSHYVAQEVLRCHVINLSVLGAQLLRVVLDSGMNQRRVSNDRFPIQFRDLGNERNER